jgi:hypothetical protein
MSGYYNARYQFKLYRGVWRMLGFTYTSGGQDYPTSDTPPDAGPTVHETQADVNLLTGDIIVVRNILDEQGKRPSGMVRYKAPSRTCLLADFAYQYLPCVKDWKTQDGREVDSLMY